MRLVEIKGTRYKWYIFRHFYKGDNFCDFLFALLYTNPYPKKGSTLKGKNLLPIGANSFLLEEIPFSDGSETKQKLAVVSLKKYHFPLK